MKPPMYKVVTGSFVALLLGTSCCWISALGVWVGGFTVVGVTITMVKDLRNLIIVGGVILFLIAWRFYPWIKKIKIGSK